MHALVARRLGLGVLAILGVASAQERTVDPTWLHRNLSTVQEAPSDITTSTCHYKPIFGEGDVAKSALAGVARYGEAVIDPHGSCSAASLRDEDQILVVLQGAGVAKYGAESVQLRAEDYLYVPAGISHSLRSSADAPLRAIIMGFRTAGFEPAAVPAYPLKANIEDVPVRRVSGHPASALYRLLLGDVNSKRDRIAAGRVVPSLL